MAFSVVVLVVLSVFSLAPNRYLKRGMAVFLALTFAWGNVLSADIVKLNVPPEH
ncbi:MAG: hypothetical protein MI864_25470 [Pseudomonadales bacterium]|nr:hypothetical protein [Pseudomonadales bacterium]